MFIYPNKPKRIYDVDTFVKTLGTNWVVQSKWDGKRCHPFCDAQGNITMYSRHKTIFKGNWKYLSSVPFKKPWYLDGELLSDNRIVIWDIATIGGKNIYSRPYRERLALFDFDTDAFKISDTLPASEYKKLLYGDSKIEGVVFKNLDATNFWGVFSTNEVYSQFKYRLR